MAEWTFAQLRVGPAPPQQPAFENPANFTAYLQEEIPPTIQTSSARPIPNANSRREFYNRFYPVAPANPLPENFVPNTPSTDPAAPANPLPENFVPSTPSTDEPFVFQFELDQLYPATIGESIDQSMEAMRLLPDSTTLGEASSLPMAVPSLSFGSSTADSFSYDTTMTRETSTHSQIPEMARVDSAEGFVRIYRGFDGENINFVVGTGYGPSNHMTHGNQSFQLEEATTTKRKADSLLPMNGGSRPPAERRQSGGTSARPSVEVKPPNTTYVRPKHPPVHCGNCGKPFRGDHELSRHSQRTHANIRLVWVIQDRSEDGLLAKCRTCMSGKKYGADYNATAHLRRQHFKDAAPPENIKDWLRCFWVKRNKQTGTEDVVDGGSESESSEDGEDDDGPAKRICPTARNKPAPPAQRMQRNPSQRGRDLRARRDTLEHHRSVPTPRTLSTDNFSPSMPTSSSFAEQYVRLC